MYSLDLEYFPSVNSIINLYKLGVVCFSSIEPYKKSTFRNKMQVASSTGTLTLSIPIKGGRSVNLPYGEVEIDNKTNWQDLHFKTIKTVYGSAPYYQFYAYVLSDLYTTPFNRLFDWNFKCLDTFLKLSKMTNMIQASICDTNEKIPESLFFLENVELNNGLELFPYPQVFSKKTGFKANMSCIDLLMNLGPDCGKYIVDLTNKLH